MTKYHAAHWGTYRITEGARGPRLSALPEDPDPSPIGLHQLAPELASSRISRPAVRESWLRHGPSSGQGERGKDRFVEVSWHEALDLVAAELTRVRNAHGNEAIFGGSYGWASAGRFHHAQSQLKRFLNCIGGFVSHRDSYSLGAARVLLPHVIGDTHALFKQHTTWDVLAEHCELFIAFGGVPEKNAQISQAGVGKHRVREGLQAMAGAGCRFVNVSPIASSLETGGPVDWMAAKPGSDTALMLGLAHEIHRLGRHDRAFLATHCTGWDIFEPYLVGESDGQPKSADWAAALTGIAVDRIRDLAREMTEKRTTINIAWALQRADNGEQPFWMALVLAAMLGQIGLPGGGIGLGYGCENLLGSPEVSLKGPTLSQGHNPVDAFIPVARIVDMLERPGTPFAYNGGTYRYPDIRLIYWAGGNPFHHHQDLTRLHSAWQKPETIIVHEPFWTATARRADIVLPATMTTEREDIGYADLEGVLLASRAAVKPHGEARDDHAILAGLAQRLEVEEAFTEGRDTDGWLRHLYETTRTQWKDSGIELPGFDDFREIGLVDLSAHATPERVMLSGFRADPKAHPLDTPSGKLEIFSETIAGFGLHDVIGHPRWMPPKEWLGAEASQACPLHMISDQPSRRLHSQLDPSPHSCAGKIHGREALDMHPQDAAARDLTEGMLVELFNARGRCLAALRITGDLRPGVVRLSTGAWFDPDATGRDRHGNPNVLTDDRPASLLSGGCTAHSCLVDVRAAGADAEQCNAFAPPEFVSG